jgi:hypothetical protein
MHSWLMHVLKTQEAKENALAQLTAGRAAVLLKTRFIHK